MSRLEILMKAYVEITTLWGKASVGDNASRMWESCRFLEKLIKKEMKRHEPFE